MLRLLWGFALCIVLSLHECHGLGAIVTECSLRADIVAGSICGTVKNYTNNDGVEKSFASFRGVPYAEQPVGEYRFTQLQPLQPWEGILDTSVEGPICPQTDTFYEALMQSNGMSESCITANIHVPLETFQEATATYNCLTTSLPVFVFVHGGGFTQGSGDGDIHGPEYLLDKDVIVVTFNYRLGITGFLSLNTTEVPGNSGLRDMITLLDWVQTNIACFGGNPDEVTIGGQSAGGSAVHFLTLSQAAQGLFKRAISMSGVAVRNDVSISPLFAQSQLQTLLTILNITTTETEEIYEQLKAMSYSTLLNATASLSAATGGSLFNPVIENSFEGVTPVIDADTEILMDQGRGNDIPIIYSFTEAESDLFRKTLEDRNVAAIARQNAQVLVPQKILLNADADTLPEIISEIEQEYFPNITTDNYIKFSSDSYFMYPAVYAARKQAALGGAAVYLAQFSYQGDYRVAEVAFDTDLNGATHGEDLFNLFKVHSIPGPTERTQADLDMQYWLPELYSNFVKTGNPSSDWPVFVADDVQYQDIREPKVLDTSDLSDLQETAVEFFDNLYVLSLE